MKSFEKPKWKPGTKSEVTLGVGETLSDTIHGLLANKKPNARNWLVLLEFLVCGSKRYYCHCSDFPAELDGKTRLWKIRTFKLENVEKSGWY